jgi:mRNA interferase MazF
MTIKRWSVYRADLDPVVGSEQGKTRPVLVISEDGINNLLNIINVIPITTRKAGRTLYPNEALLSASTFGLQSESIVLCHKIRTLDKQRLTFLYGEIGDPKKQEEIINALCFQLGIDRSIGTNL